MNERDENDWIRGREKEKKRGRDEGWRKKTVWMWWIGKTRTSSVPDLC